MSYIFYRFGTIFTSIGEFSKLNHTTTVWFEQIYVNYVI